MKGLHILAEFHDCACADQAMRDPAAVQRLCLAACASAGLTVVGQVFHGFGTPEAPAGATGAVVLAESHLAVHTWPELDAVTLDLYVCNYSRDHGPAARAALERLLAAFQPDRCERREVERGRLDS